VHEFMFTLHTVVTSNAFAGTSSTDTHNQPKERTKRIAAAHTRKSNNTCSCSRIDMKGGWFWIIRGQQGPTPQESVSLSRESWENSKGGDTQGIAAGKASTLAMNLVTSSSTRRCKPLNVSEADLTFACATAWVASLRRSDANIRLVMTATASPSGAVPNMKKDWCSTTSTYNTFCIRYAHALL
jgi:hypothetical protein